MAELFLVRHAQASFGHADYDNLSELGHEQSVLLGEYFAQRSQSFDAVITGDMKRHMQTASGILQSISGGIQTVDASWNEFDFDNIVRAYLIVNPSHKPADDAPRSEWYKVLRNAMLTWSKDELKTYNGESWAHFVSRVNAGANAIQNSPHKRVLVVTSGGAMAVFLMILLNTSVEQAIAFNLQIKNTSVNQFFFNPKSFQLNSFNNVPHLDTLDYLNKITYS